MKWRVIIKGLNYYVYLLITLIGICIIICHQMIKFSIKSNETQKKDGYSECVRSVP